MVSTVRLVEALEVEAKGYAEGLGLSLNGLIAVALREYLDRRRYGAAEGEKLLQDPQVMRRAAAADARVVELHAESAAREAVRAARLSAVVDRAPEVEAPANRRGPCPCGSGERYHRCHGRVGTQQGG